MMKVSSIGIDTYRQSMSKPPVGNQPAAAKQSGIERPDKVQISGKTDRVTSKLAVKLKSGTFDDLLSPEEKEALEMLFAKLDEIHNGSYGKNGEENKAHIGNFVDVRL